VQIGSTKELIGELKHIVDWKVLGEELGMKAHRLEQIDNDHASNEHKQRAMLRCVEIVWVNLSNEHGA